MQWTGLVLGKKVPAKEVSEGRASSSMPSWEGTVLRGTDELLNWHGSHQPVRRSLNAVTDLRNLGEIMLGKARDLTAGNAGKLDGDFPGLLDVVLGAGVCEEPALGEEGGRVGIAAGAAERRERRGRPRGDPCRHG